MKYATNWTVIESDLTSLSYTIENQAPASGQAYTQYAILATNSIGDAPGIIRSCGASVILGTPYALPFAESFAGAALSTSPWIISALEGSTTWFLYDTMSSDNDGGSAGINVEAGASRSALYGPKVSLEAVANPVMSMDVYLDPSYSDDYVLYIKGKINDERPVVLKEIKFNEGNGWVRYDIPMSDYAGSTVCLEFETYMPGAGSVYVDAVSLEDVIDHDLALISIEAPAHIDVAQAANVNVTVTNRGALNAESYRVEIYENGMLASAHEGANLASRESAVYAHPIVTTIYDAGITRTYNAKVIYGADMNAANNESDLIEVNINRPNYPSVTDLTASNDEDGIRLEWSEPESTMAAPVTDDMSAYESFAIDGIGAWTEIGRAHV